MSAHRRCAAQTGIGLTLLPVFYAHADFGGAPPNPAQRRLIHDVDGFAQLLDAKPALARCLTRCSASPRTACVQSPVRN
jgi:hypothetical protein